MLKKGLAIAGFGAAVLIACGGSSSSGGGTDGGGGSGGSIALGDVPKDLAQAYCDLYAKCYGQLAGALAPGEDCVTRTQRSIEDGGFNELQSSVDSGTVVYHADLVPACLDAIKAQSCDKLLQRSVAECESAVAGTVAAGGDCTIDNDCKGPGLFCQSSGACPGKCTALLAPGQDCTRDAMCESGLSCDTTTKKCVKPPAIGEACGGNVKPDCASPGLCIGQDTQKSLPGTCQAVDTVLTAAAGAACNPKDGPWCAGAVPCVVQSLDTSGNFTAACGDKVASGAACHVAIPDQCPAGEYCDITVQQLIAGQTGTCQKAPAAGQTCATSLDGAPGCAPYTRCDPTTGKCVGLQRLGETCTTDLACYSGRCSNGGCAPAACGS